MIQLEFLEILTQIGYMIFIKQDFGEENPIKIDVFTFMSKFSSRKTRNFHSHAITSRHEVKNNIRLKRSSVLLYENLVVLKSFHLLDISTYSYTYFKHLFFIKYFYFTLRLL